MKYVPLTILRVFECYGDTNGGLVSNLLKIISDEFEKKVFLIKHSNTLYHSLC